MGPTKDATWLAIHQPGVLRHAEAALSGNPDALALTLDLACALFDEAGRRVDRLDDHSLAPAVADPTLAAWIAQRVITAPVALTRAEEAQVTALVAAIAAGIAGREVLAGC